MAEGTDRAFFARQLWLAHFTVLLAVLFDRSPRHAQTRRLAADLATGIARAWPMVRTPSVHAFLERVDALFG